MSIRARFCPSPTGFLHIGSLRTALFNWLFVRHHGGAIVLRIEDTDAGREAAGAVEQIARSLEWIGLDFDESPAGGGPFAPYVQSERLERYRAVVGELVAGGHAYPDYQSAAELEAARAAARETDDPASPTRAHRELTRPQIAAFVAAGRVPVIRFAAPGDGETVVHDLVRGEIRWSNRLLGDHVLMRPGGLPTYQLANPVDDLDMQITHVIRGDDLLASTPRQKLLVEALGGSFPETGHLSMVLGPDRKRYSKRHGAVSAEEFRAGGILPEALFNYLALVGWGFDDHTELMTRDELVERFDIARVNPAPAVFDETKLRWMNGVYLRGLDAVTYEQRLREHLAEQGSPLAGRELGPVVPLVQEKIATLADFDAFAGFLFHPVVYAEAAWQRLAATPNAAGILAATSAALANGGELEPDGVEAALRGVCDELDLKPRVAFLPPRVAVSGSTVSPGLFESIVVLGREETLARLEAARARLA